MKLVDRTDIAGPVRDYIGYGPDVPAVVWPNQATLALNLVLNIEEGSEYSHPAGDGRNEGGAELPGWGMEQKYRDLMAEQVFEYGSRVGAWRLLRMFDEYGVKATMFATAIALERNPAIGKWIQKAGHDVCSHGWRWVEHWLLSREEEKAHIAAAVEFDHRNLRRAAEWLVLPLRGEREHPRDRRRIWRAIVVRFGRL